MMAMVERVMTEHEQRRAVVAEALSWVGTPYHHAARVKGAGADCGLLLAAVYEAAGVLPRVDPGAYPHDWMLHRDEERYLELVQAHAREIEGPPQPGDTAVWRFGRTYSHGALVLEWPQIVHAFLPAGEVVVDDALANQALASRPVRFFSPWGER